MAARSTSTRRRCWRRTWSWTRGSGRSLLTSGWASSAPRGTWAVVARLPESGECPSRTNGSRRSRPRFA
eukprot:13282975-Alexandrium_andersonii.AAC.1